MLLLLLLFEFITSLIPFLDCYCCRCRCCCHYCRIQLHTHWNVWVTLTGVCLFTFQCQCHIVARLKEEEKTVEQLRLWEIEERKNPCMHREVEAHISVKDGNEKSSLNENEILNWGIAEDALIHQRCDCHPHEHLPAQFVAYEGAKWVLCICPCFHVYQRIGIKFSQFFTNISLPSGINRTHTHTLARERKQSKVIYYKDFLNRYCKFAFSIFFIFISFIRLCWWCCCLPVSFPFSTFFSSFTFIYFNKFRFWIFTFISRPSKH